MSLPSLKVFYFGNFNWRQAGIIIVADQYAARLAYSEKELLAFAKFTCAILHLHYGHNRHYD